MQGYSVIKIADYKIGQNCFPFIIAEMSGNHNQSLERALAIVEAAAQCGVHGLKLQTYTADTMTIDKEDGEFYIEENKSLWNGTSLYKLYQKAYTPWEWHKPLFKKCNELGLIGFSTPFDLSAVDFLEDIDVPCYKVASFENVDIPLLRRIAQTKKPVIMSTGMASISELDDAVQTLRKNGCDDIILLKCTSSYPSTPENSNVLTIPHMRVLFNCEVGLSDHTIGIGASIASVALGATVIEKHFTLSREDGGVDSAFSMEPEEMKNLVIETGRAWQALGHVSYGLTDEEKSSIIFRRSLYIISDLKAGDILTKENIKSIRPGFGLPPKYYDLVIGKKINRDIGRGTPLSWEMILQ